MFTADQKLKAVERELTYRRFVYQRRVETKAMTRQQADLQIALFEEIADDYRKLAASERLI